MDIAANSSKRARLDADNPWPGLESYDEASQEFFSGRSVEARELQRRVLDEPVTVLFGKSGLGKTSLLRAGVFPTLRQKGFFPVFVRLQVRSGAEPFMEQVRTALFAELKAQSIDYPEPKTAQTPWEWLHEAGLEFWTQQNHLVKPVFVFDQFEELFTLGGGVPAEVEAFRQDLADLAQNRVPAALGRRLEEHPASELGLDLQSMPYKLVISLREDFLADLEEWRPGMPSLRHNRMRLLPMGTEQALEAVHNARTQELVSEALALKIVAFLASTGANDGVENQEDARASVEPALLSLFCRGVNEQRKRAGKPAFDEALLEGAKATIVADFYRDSLKGQRERVQRFIEEQLVTEQGFRNSCSVDDAFARGDLTREELERLVDRRLLRYEHHLGAGRVELTHDLLTKAIVAERDRRRQAERIEGELKKRKRLASFVVLGLLSLFLVATTVWAVIASRNANTETGRANQASKEAKRLQLRAESRELAAHVEGEVESDPQLAVLLALEALKSAETPEAYSALIHALRFAWPMVTLAKEQGLEGEPEEIALSPDGNRLAVRAFGGLVTIWDVSKSSPVRLWQSRKIEDALSLAFSPDGVLLAVRRPDAIELWSLETKTMSPLAQPGKGGVTFSADNLSLASFSDSEISIWSYREARPASQTIPLRQEERGVLDVSFLPGSATEPAQLVAIRGGDPLEVMTFRHAGRDASSTWGHAAHVPLEKCSDIPRSVALRGADIFATFPALTCTPAIAKPDPLNSEPVRDGRIIKDSVWTRNGVAGVEVLENLASKNLDLSVRSSDDSWPAHRIKGARLNADEQNLVPVVALSDDGKRLAVLSKAASGGASSDQTRSGEIRIYSLGEQKALLSALPNSAAVAPDGSWFAVQRGSSPTAFGASSSGESLIDVIEIDGTRAREPIRLRGVRPGMLATPFALVVEFQREGPGGQETRLAAYDPKSGKPIFERPYRLGDAIGEDRSWLRVLDSSAGVGDRIRFVRARDGKLDALQLAETDRINVLDGGTTLAVQRHKPSDPAVQNAPTDWALYRVAPEGLVAAGLLQNLPRHVELSLSSDNRQALVRSLADAGERVWMVWPIAPDKQTDTRGVPLWSSAGFEDKEWPIVRVRFLRPGFLAITSRKGDQSSETAQRVDAVPAKPSFKERAIGTLSSLGDYIAGSFGDRIEIVRRESGQVLLSVWGSNIQFSADDHWLAVDQLDQTEIFDLTHVQRVAQLKGVRGVQEFHTNGRIATVQLSEGGIMLVPLDRKLARSFAERIVAPRVLSAQERCTLLPDRTSDCKKVATMSNPKADQRPGASVDQTPRPPASSSQRVP